MTRPPYLRSRLWFAACVLLAACTLDHAGLVATDGAAPGIDARPDGDAHPDIVAVDGDGAACGDTMADPLNCGRCGHVCPTLPDATPSCSDGVCASACLAGFGDCDGDPANGCEAPLNTRIDCGSCRAGCASGQVCGTGDGGVAPTCRSQCGAGQVPCGAMMTCVDTSNDPMNCGGCGAACGSRAHGSFTCTGGVCMPTCNAGFMDCNAMSADGCETDTSRYDNCGGCGSRCAPANAAPACPMGVCTLASCNAGFGDCDGVAANGCETPLTMVANCGACAHACTAPMNAMPTCAPSCGFVCNPGFMMSGAACVAAPCGNHTLDTGEQCDDGNLTPGDGCDATCHAEFLTSVTCPHASLVLNPGTQSYAGDTSAAGLMNTNVCGGGPGMTANDIAYLVHYNGAAMNVTVTLRPAFSAVLTRRDTCAGAEGLCQSPITTGTTYTMDFTVPSSRSDVWIVDGYRGAQGAYTISFNLH